MRELKRRGVESVSLFVSDALTGIEDAVKRVYPNSTHQFCVVRLKCNILVVFPHKAKKKMSAELHEVIPLETKSLPPVAAFNKFSTFVDEYALQYPPLKRF